MLRAAYFDGRSTRMRAVVLSVADGHLVIAGDQLDRRVPLAAVRVDEQLGRAPRRLRLGDGAFCEVRDAQGLAALLASMGHRDGHVDRMQRHLPAILLACAGCVVLAAAGYKWGLPWAAAEGARHLPPAVGRTLSAETLKALDGSVLLPSKLPGQRQQALEEKFHALRTPRDGGPGATLLFRRSPQLGANAFALPDGTVIVLDDLVTTIDDEPRILAVLAHELGHVHGRHGLQQLLQSSAVAALATLYFGDISQLLAAAPAAVVQAKYSQELEQQADDFAAAALRANGLSPGLLADALDTLAKSHPGAGSFGFLSSHPSTVERMRRLRELGAAYAGR